MTLTIPRPTLAGLAGQERDDAFLDLWLEGRSYREISRRDDVTITHMAVGNAIKKALARRTAERDRNIDNAITGARARAHKLLAVCWEMIRDADNAEDLARGVREARRTAEFIAKIEGVLDVPEADAGDAITLAEVQGEALVQVLILVLGSHELGLDDEKQAVARVLAGQHLRALAS